VEFVEEHILLNVEFGVAFIKWKAFLKERLRRQNA
jgi:hypothetical protein